MTTNEPTKCPACGGKEYRAIEATALPDVDVICVKCETPYKSAGATSGGGFKIAPTTGEIVRELRAHCNDAPYTIPYYDAVDYAIDRLKSHEQKIEWYNDLLDMSANTSNDLEDQVQAQEQTIADLTARAEQAEAGEKAVIAVMNGFCQFCEHYEKGENEEPCRSCESVTHDGRESKWTWRGLPQDGEGKK